MLKVTIKGEPDEIASFLFHLEESDAVEVEYATAISKRAAHHQWGSALAGLHVELVPGVSADVTIYEGKGKRKSDAVRIPGYVYLIPFFGPAGIEGYKIGKTTNPHSRRRTFSVKLNFTIIFIALIRSDDYSALERQLHQQYAAKRTGANEWFDLDTDEVMAIQALMSDADKKLLEKINT